MTEISLWALVDSWKLDLRAARKSPGTIKTYDESVTRFLNWCDQEGVPQSLDARTVKTFTIAILDAGGEASTARTRLNAIRQFSAWCATEGEIDRDEIAGLRSPRVDTKVVQELTGAQLTALVKACAGRSFLDRRDEAIIRLMAETGARSGEVVAMAPGDVDLSAGEAVIRRGKGGKGRTLPIGPQTVRAIDRYLRMRRTHRLADGPRLWLGGGGRGFGYAALYLTLVRRGEQAGLPETFHPHVLRHTAAGRWLDAGGSEGGLMEVAGWSSRKMIDRYTKSSAARRAGEEARRLNLGDIG